MRRIITILLAMLMLFSNNVFATHASFDTLSNLKVMPEEFSKAKTDEVVTRQEFAYIAAKLASTIERPAKDTRFTDVTSENRYSGYIEYLAEIGAISGVNGSTFNPTGNLDIHMACKILVCILGFGEYAEARGGYPQGYYDFAHRFELLRGVEPLADGIMSQKATVQIVENALLAEVDDVFSELRMDDMLLYKTFGVEIYNGFITDVFQDTCSAVFAATSKKGEKLHNGLNIGESTFVNADSSIDLNKWENVPITVWMDSENKIIYAYPQKGVEVRYEYIDSVNGNTDDGALYSIDDVSRLTIRYDEEEYGVLNGTQLKYNNKMTDTAVPLVGNFAKLVFRNDEVIYMESWEMEEGGIITAASAYEIIYTKGKTQNFKLKELDKFKNKKIFIGGRSADISELRTDTVFSYNISGDAIAITASEKIIVDTFNMYTPEHIEIGDALYKFRNVYYSEDGVKYKEDGNFTVLLGRNVKAYLSPDGFVQYLKLENQNEANISKFYGVVTGVERDKWEEEIAKVKMYRVDGEKPEEVIYDVNERTVYHDGINLEMLSATSNDYDGKGVYYFELNPNGRIKSIRKPYDFIGFEGESGVTVFSSEATLSAGNGKFVFVDDVKITAIYQKDGKFTVGCYRWLDFANQDPANTIKTRFLGNGEVSSTPTMLLMTGDFTRVGGSRIMYHGIVSSITVGVNEDGDVCKNITFVGKDTNTYQVSPDEVRDLKLYDLLAYYNGQEKFSDNPIYRSGTHIHLPDVINSWQPVAPLKVGYVSFIDSKMIYLEDGEAYYFSRSANYFAQMEERSNGEYKVSVIAYNDIMPGDRVIYVAANDGVRGVIKIVD